MGLKLFNSFGFEFQKRIGALIKSLFSVLTFYLEVKIELWRLLILAKSKRLASVTLVFDLKVIGPGYGDYLSLLHLALVLQRKFFVEVIFVNRGRRPDWRAMNLEQQIAQIEHYERMTLQVLKGAKSKTKWVKSLEDCRSESLGTHVVFESRVFNKRGTWHHSAALAKAIFHRIGCGDDQLFGPHLFGPLRETPKEKFVVWHVRRGNILPGRIVTIESFCEQYYRIRASLGPKIEVVLLSSPHGLEELIPLAFELGLDLTSSRKYSDDFVGDLNLVHRSTLYIQFGNGGMYIGAVCSKTSYFLGSNVFRSHIFNSSTPKWILAPSNRSKAFGSDIRKSKVSPWQSSTQVLQTFKFCSSSETAIDWIEFEKLVSKLDFA